MPTHRDDEEDRILESYRQDDDAELMEILDEASRRRKENDAFKLHFPVPKDRTMRRLAISQLILLVVAPASCVTGGILVKMGRIEPPPFSKEVHYMSPYGEIALPFILVGILSTVVLFLVIPVIRSSVMTRRYGWRAMQDPIEAHRVAVREGMADVLIAKDRIGPNLEQQSLPPIGRRLRPIIARHRNID